jgi:hypothetical protein
MAFRPSPVRRRILLSVAAGSVGVNGFSFLMSEAIAKGDIPTVPGINRLQGQVQVNGKEGRVGTPVNIGDRVTTGKASLAVVVINKDAFLMRENTEIEFTGNGGLLDRLKLSAGQLLSVFGKGQPRAIQAKNATIGIRGTGAYVEVHEGRTYLCLCYGEAQVALPRRSDPITVKTIYHESPMWLYDDRAEKGPFENHTDKELDMLEGLHGRETPFSSLPQDVKRYD